LSESQTKKNDNTKKPSQVIMRDVREMHQEIKFFGSLKRTTSNYVSDDFMSSDLYLQNMSYYNTTTHVFVYINNRSTARSYVYRYLKKYVVRDSLLAFLQEMHDWPMMLIL
jgi:formaldehyde-activating enzyme involved in methanogenesis